MNMCTDGFPGVVAPVLSADVLGHVHQLNLDYLELLLVQRAMAQRVAEHDCLQRGGLSDLPERVLDTLHKATPAARQLIASAAFSLYSLGFEDQELWRSALRADARPVDGRYAIPSGAAVQSSFCELALMHAWHVAVTQPLAASVLYGMPTQLIELLSRARLWQLRRIALECPELLMPRWPGNPCFWPEMIRFAVAGDSRRLHTIQQLGHQLIAIDLQTSTGKRNAARDRQYNLLRQRLRARSSHLERR